MSSDNPLEMFQSLGWLWLTAGLAMSLAPSCALPSLKIDETAGAGNAAVGGRDSDPSEAGRSAGAGQSGDTEAGSAGEAEGGEANGDSGEGPGGAEGLGGRVGAGGSGTGGIQGLGGRIGAGGLGAGGSSGNCTIPDSFPADPGAGTCSDFAPCGGDLTGTWTITEFCLDPPLEMYSQLCTDSIDTMDVEGTFTFGADGSYLTSGTVHMLGYVTADCLSTYSTTCGVSPFESCMSTSDGDCGCDDVFELESEAGLTWTSQGNLAILIHSDCTVEASYYCVSGDVLRLRSGDATQRYTYVLERM